MTTPHDAPSVIERVELGEWSSERSAAYEAALEAINGVVGACSALIDRAGPQDSERIAAWTAERHQCARERERLRPGDEKAVADTRRRYTERARILKELLS